MTAKLVAVKVHPRASRDRVERTADGGFAVWTVAAPDKGAANEAVTKLLARELGIAPGRIVLKRGATSRNKLFEIAG
jgi:hypothetical protein